MASDGLTFVLPWFPLILAQVLRGACIIVAPLCIVICVQLARHANLPRSQRYRFAGLASLLLAAAYIAIVRWEDQVSPVLFLNVAGSAFSFLGLWSLRSETTSK